MISLSDVQNFVNDVNQLRNAHYAKHYPSLECPQVQIEVKQKWYKLTDNRSVWGFVAKKDGAHKGLPMKAGDLMFPASWNAAAKHSRGNILDGSASYSVNGPTYLK